MMREIKFRAWDGREMGEPRPHDDLNNLNHVIQRCISIGQTLMQYTGLKDKNGKEIYEGDIIKFRWFVFEVKKEITAWIEYNPPEFENIIISPKEIAGKSRSLSILELNNEAIEVIGNLYENPELLKEQSK